MAVKKQAAFVKAVKPNVSRPNVHDKSQTSSLKSSKNYKKLYKGQGR